MAWRCLTFWLSVRLQPQLANWGPAPIWGCKVYYWFYEIIVIIILLSCSWGPYNWPSEMRPYLSSYWPDFDQTLKVGSWDPLEQIPTVRWHLSRQHLSRRHLSISVISQLLLAWFWPNFEGRFLWPFWINFPLKKNLAYKFLQKRFCKKKFRQRKVFTKTILAKRNLFDEK